MAKIKDIVGERFGRRVVLEFIRTKFFPSGGQTSIWKCLCDCGSITETASASIRTTTSCGCLQQENAGIAAKKRNSKESGVASFNGIYHGYQSRSKKKDIIFNISKEEFRYLTQQNCYYCGGTPSTGNWNKQYMNGRYIYNGLDRVDNSKGYEIDNIVTCCEICNKAKRDLTKEEFLKWAIRLGLYQLQDQLKGPFQKD